MMDETGAQLDSFIIEIGGENPTTDSVSTFEDDMFDIVLTKDRRSSNSRHTSSNNNNRVNIVDHYLLNDLL